MAKMSTRTKIATFIAIIVVIGAVFAFSNSKTTRYNSQASSPTTTPVMTLAPSVPDDIPQVKIGNKTIPVEIKQTKEEIKTGLSGRRLLNKDSGMLFIFNAPAIYQFWMPNMHFPIDIIWINQGKIVDISHDVPTDFDPAAPIFYKPQQPAQYVLEVNAGFSADHGIKIGDVVTFKNIL